MIKQLIKKGLNAFGLQLSRVDDTEAEQQRDLFETSKVPYVERPEYGPSNIETKLVKGGRGDGPFDYPNMLNLNRDGIS